MSRAKIVATLGPSSLEPGMLERLVSAGMDVARLNGAHGDHGWHRKAVAELRRVAPELPILLDLPGVKVRIGSLAQDRAFQCGDPVVLTCRKAPGRGELPLTRPDVCRRVRSGLTLSFDDSSLQVQVRTVEDQDLLCVATRSGAVSQGKGVHAPGVAMSAFVVCDRDRALLALARELGIDFVGLSYVDEAAQVEQVRALCGAEGPKLIAKIETRLGLANLAGIIRVADGLMIDRGDLSMETSLESVAISQKQILAEAMRAACPVIVATQMLHTMIDHPYPTKAEVADITAAVLDGASALMLSGETAMGAYPAEAIAVMGKVVAAAGGYQQGVLDQGSAPLASQVPSAVSEAIALICRRLPVTRIVAITKSGYAARILASFLPRQPIIAVSNDPAMVRQFNLLRGVLGVLVDAPFARSSTAHIPSCLEALWRRGLLADDDLIVVTAVAYPASGNRMNLMETHVVSDLKTSLGWAPRKEAGVLARPNTGG